MFANNFSWDSYVHSLLLLLFQFLHQAGDTRVPVGIVPRTFLLTNHCTTTGAMPVIDICQLKDHLQTKGRKCFYEM